MLVVAGYILRVADVDIYQTQLLLLLLAKLKAALEVLNETHNADCVSQ